MLALPISPVALGASEQEPTRPPPAQCPLTLTLKFAPKLTHDFGNGGDAAGDGGAFRPAELPVIVALTNRMCEPDRGDAAPDGSGGGGPVDFVFEVINPTNYNSPAKSASGFEIAGASSSSSDGASAAARGGGSSGSGMGAGASSATSLTWAGTTRKSVRQLAPGASGSSGRRQAVVNARATEGCGDGGR